MNTVHRLAASVALVGLIAGCSGGGRSVVPSPASGQTPIQSPGQALANANAKASVAVTLTSPAANPSSANRRTPQYVSPAINTIVFSGTPYGGSTISTAYDVSIANTQPQGGTPTLAKPCVFDGGPNNERICTLYAPAQGGVKNHFVVQTYLETVSGPPSTLISLGATGASNSDNDPSIAVGATKSVTITLDPMLAVNAATLQGVVNSANVLDVVVDGELSQGVPLAITPYDGGAAILSNPDPFAQTSLSDANSLVDGVPVTENYTLVLSSKTQNSTGFSTDAACLNPAPSTSNVSFGNAAAITPLYLCYNGSGKAGDDTGTNPPFSLSLSANTTNPGTLGTLTLNPLFVRPVSPQPGHSMQITVTQNPSGPDAGATITADTSNCPSSVATLNSNTVTLDSNGYGTLTLQPGSVAGTCPITFTENTSNVAVTRTYVVTSGSITITIP